MIMAVPASVTTIGLTGYLSDRYDAQLQDLINNSVKLRIPLNTSIRLAKVAFDQVYTLDEICSTQLPAYTAGISEPFTISGEDRKKTIQITTLQTNFYSALGTLDTTFNSVGYAVHDSAAGGSSLDVGKGIALDASGRILVTGISSNGAGNNDMAIWRYNADGTLDTSFASQGYVVHDNAAGGSSHESAEAIVLDASGRILVAGSSTNGTPNSDMAIWRYNVDGTLDTSFASQGFVVHDDAAGGSGNDYGYGIALDANGRILVAGESDNGTPNYDMAIWRYNVDGTLDTSFNSVGYVVHDSAAGGNDDDKGNVITLDASGRILVAGESDNGTPNTDMAIWRYNVDGTLDTSFASQGFVVHHGAAGGSSNDIGYGIALDSNGRILVAGYSNNGTPNQDMAIWRYNADGTVDTTFASQGFVVHDDAAGGSGNDYGEAIVLDASGRILVGGRSVNGTLNYDMAIWRYE